MRSDAALAVARKDLALEARALEQVALIGMLAFLVMLLFRAASASLLFAPPVGAAVWITLVFAGTAGLARTFHSEAEAGTLDLLVASPAAPASVYLGKVLAGAAVAGAAALAAVAFGAAFFGPSFISGALFLFLALGCVGLAAVAAFLSAVSARAHARTALFPVLVMPLLVPLALWAAQGTVAATAGAGLGDPLVFLNLAYLAAYDALFLGLFSFLAPRALSA